VSKIPENYSYSDVLALINEISLVTSFRKIKAEIIVKELPDAIFTGTIANGLGEYYFYTDRNKGGICVIDPMYNLNREKDKIISLKTIGEWY
jgi:hypothetical protein